MEERGELEVDVKTGDKAGRASGGVEASISESVVSDVARPSNARLTTGVAGGLAGKVGPLFRLGTVGVGGRDPGLVATTRGTGLDSKNGRSSILSQDDADGREVSRR